MNLHPFIYNAIEQLAKRTGVDFHSLKRSVSWLFSAQVAASAGGLVLTIALANLLAEADYGTYKYLMTLAGLISVLSLNGIKTAATRAVAQGYEAEIHRSVRRMLQWSVGALAAGMGLAIYYLYMGNTTLGYGALILALAVPLDSAYSSFAAYLNGKQLYRQYAISGVMYSIVPVLATTTGLFFTSDPLLLFMLFMVTQSSVALLLYYLVLHRYPPNKQIADGTTQYGVHLSFMNLLGSTSLHFDKLITWHLLGPVPLAAYSVITSPPQQLRYFNKIIATIALPRFSNRSAKMLRSTVWKKAVLLWLFALSLIIPYWLVAPYLFEYVFPKYEEYVLYSQVFALIMLFFPAMLFDSALKAHEQVTALYIQQTVVPISKLVLLLILVPFFGLWGVIYTMLINRLSAFLLNIFFFYKIPDVPKTN